MPKTPRRGYTLGISTFKHAIFCPDSPTACVSPLNPMFSENDAVDLGVCDSTFKLRLEPGGD